MCFSRVVITNVQLTFWATLYVVVQEWDDDIASVASGLVRTCQLHATARAFGPDPTTYQYDAVTAFFLKTSDVDDQLRSAYIMPQFRRQAGKLLLLKAS